MELERRDGPYAPTNQMLGQVPTLIPDVNLSIALLALFLAAGVAHFVILIRNKNCGHKFNINGVAFGFCNIRIITFALRNAWANFPDNIRLGLASTVFVYAGVILLFGVNLVFTQRIVRAQHPSIGWSKPFNAAFALLMALLGIALVMIAVVVVQSFYTLSERILNIDHSIRNAGLTYFAVAAFLPILVVSASSLAGLHPSIQAARISNPVNKFGKGRMTHNVAIVLISACLLTIGAAFRAGINFLPATPLFVPGSNPPVPSPQPWYLTKGSFYSFNFVIELFIIYGWLFTRIDKRFHVPDGANGSYRETFDVENTPIIEVAASKRSSRGPDTMHAEEPVVVLEAFFNNKPMDPLKAMMSDDLDGAFRSALRWKLDHEILTDNISLDEIEEPEESFDAAKLEPVEEVKEVLHSQESLEVIATVKAMRILDSDAGEDDGPVDEKRTDSQADHRPETATPSFTTAEITPAPQEDLTVEPQQDAEAALKDRDREESTQSTQ